MSFFTQWLESIIRTYLTDMRTANPINYTVPMLTLYTFASANGSGVTAASFNKAIGDMKKAGIIGTAKGGEVVFLSNAAWSLIPQKDFCGDQFGNDVCQLQKKHEGKHKDGGSFWADGDTLKTPTNQAVKS
jgi:hypothetical protein